MKKQTKEKITLATDIIRELSGQPLKIISHEDVANYWERAIPNNITIRYTEDSIYEAIDANKRCGEQWALSYYSGQSLRQIKTAIVKRNIQQNVEQPCFYPGQNYYMRKEEEYWASKKLEPGYYLLNFNENFANLGWDEQEKSIATSFGTQYERCHEFIVLETILTNFGINNGERLLERWNHWGKETDSNGNHLAVGSFDKRGITLSIIRSPWRDQIPSSPSVCVVISRKFDF